MPNVPSSIVELVTIQPPEVSMTDKQTSVIIPAFNAVLTLGRAVRSALDQKPAPLEVLVIDDGSTDGTELVARSFPERVRFITQSHAGPAAARNRGILAARGKYIAFLDADDYWLPGFIAACQEFLETHANAVAVSVGKRFIRSDGKEHGLKEVEGGADGAAATPFIIEDFFSFWGERDHICTGSCLLRKDILDHAGGQRENLRIGEDLEYWAYLATYGKWGYCPRILWVCDSERAGVQTGWLKRYRARRQCCPTVDEWQARLLPRLQPKDMPGFVKARGRVAAILAHNLILGGHQLKAKTTVRDYSSEMPQSWSSSLMRAGNKYGWLGWRFACAVIWSRELQKAFQKALLKRFATAPLFK